MDGLAKEHGSALFRLDLWVVITLGFVPAPRWIGINIVIAGRQGLFPKKGKHGIVKEIHAVDLREKHMFPVLEEQIGSGYHDRYGVNVNTKEG
jgi:hypothetical protein